MKSTTIELSRKYQIALASHLQEGGPVSSRKATELGRQAVHQGLETLDLAKIHEATMVSLVSSLKSGTRRSRKLKRAQAFFIQAIVPIEQTHAAAFKGARARSELSEQLQNRTGELVNSRRHLRKGIVRRKNAEQALKKTNRHNEALLRKSQSIQNGLRAMARRVISDQESERERIRSRLHENVSQELLGINVRLLTLEQAGSRNNHQLLKNIEGTQRLVERSIKMIRRMNRES